MTENIRIRLILGGVINLNVYLRFTRALEEARRKCGITLGLLAQPELAAVALVLKESGGSALENNILKISLDELNFQSYLVAELRRDDDERVLVLVPLPAGSGLLLGRRLLLFLLFRDDLLLLLFAAVIARRRRPGEVAYAHRLVEHGAGGAVEPVDLKY